MSNVVAQSIFNQTTVERNWRNHLTSVIVHVFVIGAAFLVVVPAVIVTPTASEHVTLIAPVIPRYHPKIQVPRITHIQKAILPPVSVPLAKIIPPPVVPKPIPQPVAKVVPPAVPMSAQPRITAELKPDLPPPPKPVLKTGAFQDAQLAKATPVPKQVAVGGFGDPRGVQPADNPKSSPVLMAKVGAFESPQGLGQSGGGGRSDTGSVKQSGFGAVVNNGAAAGTAKTSLRSSGFGDGSVGGTAHGAGTVRSTGFGDTVAAAAPQRRDSANSPSPFTPVEILFKPRPSYSSEARDMRLEGQVSLEVVFQASGAVKVVRVIKGLGHGLDEAAQQAAMQVRFKPATRSGAAVDTNATISIMFELT